MGDNKISAVDLSEWSKPATVLIERVSDAVGGFCKPWHLKRVARAEAEAALIKAQGDIAITQLQKRAMHRFLQEETAKQVNIEGITIKALPDVEPTANPENVEKDWLINFFDKCRITSDEQMQSLWARVLAGEANAPGKFSKRAVNFLSELDKHDAELFRALISCADELFRPIIHGYDDPVLAKIGLDEPAFVQLEELGLTKTTMFPETTAKKKLTFRYFGTEVVVEKRRRRPFDQPNDYEPHLGCILLTKVGKELAPVCGATRNEEFLDYLSREYKKICCTISLNTTLNL